MTLNDNHLRQSLFARRVDSKECVVLAGREAYDAVDVALHSTVSVGADPRALQEVVDDGELHELPAAQHQF